jgi:hypothetical protein
MDLTKPINVFAGPTARKNCVPTLRRIEIHTTYRCTMKCPRCINLIPQAPSREDMPIEHIQKLIDDSVVLNWDWDWIVLHGGESTLHPKLKEICEILSNYKKNHNDDVKLILCTNGFGKNAQEGIKLAESFGFEIGNSHREDGRTDFYGHLPYCYSPTDMGEKYTLGCNCASNCGMAYTNRGFYECSPAAAAWRVFDYEPIATELKDVTVEKLAAGFNIHCKHCGFSRINAKPENVESCVITKTWSDALEKYKNK